MHKDMKKLIKLTRKTKALERHIENSIREQLNNWEWRMCIHPEYTRNPAIAFWLSSKSLELSMRLDLHDDYASIAYQGAYDMDTCLQVKQAVDNWLKEEDNEPYK